MIVAYSNLILIPLVFNLVAVVLCCLYYAFRDKRLSPVYDAKRIYRCGVCEHVYIEARDVPLSRCPRCGCLNEPVRR